MLAFPARLRLALVGALAALIPVASAHAQTCSASPLLWSITTTGHLVSFLADSPSTLLFDGLIQGVAATETLVGVDFRPQNGFLYGLGVNSVGQGTLYVVSTRSAVASVVGTTAGITFVSNSFFSIPLPNPASTDYGLDFDPATDQLRVVAGSMNFRVDPNTGKAIDSDPNPLNPGRTPDTSINGATTSVDALAYTGSRQNATNTTLYALNSVTNSLYIQNPPASGTETLVAAIAVRGSGVDFGGVNGFDIPGTVSAASSGAGVTSGTGYAALEVGGSNYLYAINLTNGASTRVGTIDDGTIGTRGLTIQDQTGGFPAIGLNDGATQLVRFNTSSPGTVSSVPINGIASGEKLVGIDYRPSTGQLYGLAVNDTTRSSGSLYLLDPQTGVATVVGSNGLVAFAGGVALPFLTLPLSTDGWGFDFDPVTDRIKVTTTGNLNFRINPSTGASVDGDAGTSGVNPDPAFALNPTPTAAAYTNSYGGATATTLYVLDSVADTVGIIGPGATVVTDSRPLQLYGNPIDFTEVNGFDIPPGVRVTSSGTGAAGSGIAALKVGGITILYEVGLGSGWVKKLGPVGAALGGLAIGDRPVVPATVTTPIVSTLGPVSATLGGTVEDPGLGTVGRGLVYSVTSANPDPTTNFTGVTYIGAGTGAGSFTADTLTLTPDTSYSFAAYAQNGSNCVTYSPVITFRTTAGSDLITSFTATSLVVNPSGSSTLSWSTTGSSSSLTLNGNAVALPSGQQIVTPSVTTTYNLTATAAPYTQTRSVTVHVNDGTSGLGTPTVTAPTAGQSISVNGVGFTWTGVGGASGYDLRVIDASSGALRFSGSLLGSAATTSLISLPQGSYRFLVRACSGGFAATNCGPFGSQVFAVAPTTPAGVPLITFPTFFANLWSSTQTLTWTPGSVDPNLPDLKYEVLLEDLARGTTALQITVPAPTLSTVFTMPSSPYYRLRVRACQAGCGSFQGGIRFAVRLPPVPVTAPTGLSCFTGSDGLGFPQVQCSWNTVENADTYRIQVVQPPPAGPGGGALTVAAKEFSTLFGTLSVPPGGATVVLSACNGDGCGPTTTTSINAGGSTSTIPSLGTPTAGTVVAGPTALFTWNRVAGDNGSNKTYRLYVQDLSRQAAALDVFTTQNFYAAYFKAEGARYDALVIANPGPSQVAGPASGFNVSGSSATAPTMVAPAHNSTVNAGNIQLGWSPVPGATLYEYFVAVQGQSSPTARGVTPSLLAQVPLTASGGGTIYSGIVRACPAGATCALGVDAGWGPWSNVGGPGVTNFTVIP